MNIRYLLILVVMSITLFSCSNAEEKALEEDGNKEDETTTVVTDDEDDDAAEATSRDETRTSEDYRTDIGNLEIWIGGEVIVEENQVIVEGESNLLPGSRIASRGKTDTFASAAHQDITEVEEDGSFYFEFPGTKSDTEVTLNLSTGNEQVKNHYGENLEKVTGNQIYQTSDEGEYTAKYTFDIDTRKAMPYTIDLETPDWSNVPDDYGDTDIWMDVEATTKHNYLYFEGKSNLLEGSHISGKITDPQDLASSAWSSSNTQVNPDGSFQLRIHYWDLREGMEMHFEFDPTNNGWDTVLDTYGEKGENLTGDLVEQKDDGEQYVKFSIDLVSPKIEAPENVDLTLEEEEVKMQIPDDVLFDVDESKLKPEAKETLDNIMDDLTDHNSDVAIQINGHTDNQGDEEHNLNLSEERAQAVADYMKENKDIGSMIMKVQGFGETQPIASNNNEDERQKNRRVEIVIDLK